MRIASKKQDSSSKRSRKTKRLKLTHAAISLISLMFVMGTFLPVIARASVLSVIVASIRGNIANAQATAGSGSIQYQSALQPAMNINPAPATGGGDVTVLDESALMPEGGPAGTIADIEKPKNSTVSTYVVQEGDTVASVAKLFGVSIGTIRNANDIPANGSLKLGQKLTILPMTGIRYSIKQGDTLASIAKKFGGDAVAIANANNLDESSLAAGVEIIVPDVDAIVVAPAKKKKRGGLYEPAHNVGPRGTSEEIGYYIAPLAHYIETQGIHGYNGVDLAASYGTPVMAAADGTVIVAKEGGYNGGYGSYVVIQHDNGSQTLYGHLSQVSTYDGAHVSQGEVIGALGNSGKSTGPHVHFEIRNGIRNPF